MQPRTTSQFHWSLNQCKKDKSINKQQPDTTTYRDQQSSTQQVHLPGQHHQFNGGGGAPPACWSRLGDYYPPLLCLMNCKLYRWHYACLCNLYLWIFFPCISYAGTLLSNKDFLVNLILQTSLFANVILY